MKVFVFKFEQISFNLHGVLNIEGNLRLTFINLFAMWNNYATSYASRNLGKITETKLQKLKVLP